MDEDTLQKSLLTQHKVMGREKVQTFNNQTQAEDGRDALCKALYGNMFDWLVIRLNQAMGNDAKSIRLVGVLDIFGFEIFETNRFEQMMINMVG